MSKRTCLRLGIAGLMLLMCARGTEAQSLDQKINNAWTFAANQILATANLASLNAGGGNLLYPSTTTGYSTWKTTSSTSQASGWTAGFFPGELWLLYNHTENSTFQTDAEKWTYPLQYALNGSNPDKGVVLDQDVGFQTECSWGNGLLFSTDSAYNASAAVTTYVANAGYLDSRFLAEANNTGMIRSLGVPGNYSTVAWPTYPALSNKQVLSLHVNDGTVIDHMMGLQGMFNAYALDPDTTTAGYYQNAITDAVTSANEFVRNDGSSYHAVWYYDPTASGSLAGKVYGKGTIQGYANESTWSRGQAWGIYGFTQAYIYTRNDPTQISAGHVSLFLTTAQNMANYLWNNLPANLPHNSPDYVAGDYVPPSDFNADSGEQNTTTGQDGKTWYDAANTANFNQNVSGTNPSKGQYVNDRFIGLGTDTPRDTSAAAVAASAMLQLAKYEPNPALAIQYATEAADILGSLLTQSSTSGTNATDYFAQDTSGQALGAGLLLKFSDAWTATADYASSSYGDYYLLQAMTEYEQQAQEVPSVPEPACLGAMALGITLLIRRRSRTQLPIPHAPPPSIPEPSRSVSAPPDPARSPRHRH
jgi:chondroitin AC lyase